MMDYRLVSSDGETIKTIRCRHIREATVRFAEMKNLKVRDLLKIFSIECEGKN